ncbi:MAG: hypothetical protein VKK42_21020 [Lyngbya sp.]|nr:hypothetical protein [Lyngbya sp.]
MIKLLTLILMLTTGTATAADQQQTIPAQFWGKWDLDLKSCSSRGSEGSLIISADRIKFYESIGSVRSVVTHGNSDLDLTMELSGEGETWISNYYFRLSDDRKSLTGLTNGNREFVRYRCP